MTPYECYLTYLSLKQHFTVQSYDYFRYHGKVRAKRETFEKRRDRFFFDKLSRQSDPQSIIIANLLADVTYINDMISSEGLARATKYKGWLAALSRNFIEELKVATSNCSFNDLLKFNDDSQYPPLLSGLMSKQISIQTVIILDSLVHFLDNWDNHLKDDYLWPEYKLKIEKYRPFLVFDKGKIKTITVDLLLNSADIKSDIQ
jgi:hypothetical protein